MYVKFTDGDEGGFHAHLRGVWQAWQPACIALRLTRKTGTSTLSPEARTRRSGGTSRHSLQILHVAVSTLGTSQLDKNDFEPTMAVMALHTHCMTAAATRGQPCCLLWCSTAYGHLTLSHLPHLPHLTPPWPHLAHCAVPRSTRFHGDPAHKAHGGVTRVSQDCERDDAKARV